MKNKEILFARQGLSQKDLAKAHKTTISTKLLSETLDRLSDKGVSPDELSEKEFMEVIKDASKRIDGPGREMLINPIHSDLPLTGFDLYIRGMIRWMNELGIHTYCSRDGHGNGRAKIDLLKYLSMAQVKLLKAATPTDVQLQMNGKSLLLRYNQIESLLDFAENLFLLTQSPDYENDLNADHFKKGLLELLTIPGVSQDERRIRQFLKNKLRRSTDYSYVDKKGNLLAYKYCGEGPTILLSAHMDTVEEIAPGRKIIEEGTTLKSSKGILGADDRAGIAVILEILANITKQNLMAP
ncbi:peptidase M42 family protein [Neobacillus bataviensis LMG 21833]|uniref:Peptidase M42 family protein n=1 Tax=Neobacillus bataviensis LMG 21833 TaxID=1117379 RepID=K6E7N0_9BACI|nr:hypothetical protein [Neobacillus bataviensis]EKN69316.1 peptidase M42 family protein [Neobacillus bataviensis LMG 21833]